jgi:hypothetical protein
LTLLALGCPIASAEAGLLTTLGDNQCYAMTASTGQQVIFCDADIQPTGTGVINPFLRVHGDGPQKDDTPNTYTSGWNTDATKQELDASVRAWNDFDFSQSNALQDIQPTGSNYVQFTVDIADNQYDPAYFLTFNQMLLYNCDTNDYTNLAECTQPEFFNLFGDTGNFINFDTNLHHGQGSGDVTVFIEYEGFEGPYIALLDGWGCGTGTGISPAYSCDTPGIMPDHGSFEEWFSTEGGGNPPGTIPEPASLVLLGSGLSAAVAARRRRQAKKES